MDHFTPVSAATGGALIGFSTILLWQLNGRIAGVSGIVGGLLTPRAGDIAWRVALVFGLMIAPVIYRSLGGPIPMIEVASPLLIIAAGGFLVGFGTRMGSGCTSGHGVCGLARLSRRSIAATAVFMGTAMATSFLLRHVAGL